MVFGAVADDAEVFFEVEGEDAEGVAHVLLRGRDGDEREDDVALADVVLDPFAVDRDVAFLELEAVALEQALDLVVLQVHAVDDVAVVLEQAVGQRVADEAVDAENQDADGAGLLDDVHLSGLFPLICWMR